MAESVGSATEPVPVLNKYETIIGLPLTFFLVATFSVAFRIYVRAKMVRQLGLDDLFVVLAYLVSTGAIVFIFIQAKHGLGKHDFQITSDKDWTIYLICQYASNCLYQGATTFIKLSILFQYLRLFTNSQLTRRLCYLMLVLVTMWGLSFLFVQIFTCSPVRFYWYRRTVGRCWGFGSNTADSFTSYVAQTSSNMVFDILILVLPVPALTTLQFDRKQKFGLLGLFTLGSAVGVTSVLRLQNIIAHRAGTYPTRDIPWWTPPLIIISSIEINLAIVCASIPIFWPVIANWKQFSNILVINEVEIRREKRHDSTNSWGFAADPEDHAPMGTKGSMSVRSAISQEELSLKGAYEMELQDIHTKSGSYKKEYYQKNWRQGDLVPSDRSVQVNIRSSGPSLGR